MGFGRFAVSAAVLPSWLGGFRVRWVSEPVASLAAEGCWGGGRTSASVVIDSDLGDCVGWSIGFPAVELCRVEGLGVKSRLQRKGVGDLSCTDLPVAKIIRNINEKVLYNELKLWM
jgi:hypothetical protein